MSGKPPVLHPGDLLAGRYRLEDAVADPLEGTHGSSLWRALDEVLARPVAVRLLPAGGRAGAAAAAPFLRAAGLASGLASPGLARVYDAAVEQLRGGRRDRSSAVAYVVSEWVDGRSLAEVLAEGPVEPDEAVRLAVQACEAVAGAHARGVAHGRLHPGNVRLTPAGRVVVTDAAVAAAVDGRDTALPDDEDAARALVADDTRDLAAVAFALLTGRWPADATPQPAAGVPVVPGRDRRSYSPRLVRAGVPRDLDALVTRALAPRPAGAPAPGLTGPTGAPATPRQLATALEQAGRALAPPPAPTPRPAAPRAPSRWRRALPVIASIAFVAAFATGTYALGRVVGKVPGQDATDLDALVQPTPSTSPGATRAVKIALDGPGVRVRDFDPQGADGGERPEEVANAFDGDVTTAWLTSRYRSATFGGLKTGVGLLVDLGAVTPLSRVDVALTKGGTDLEVRVADTEPADAPATRLVAQRRDASGVVRLGVPAGTRARFVLIWVTGLPEEDGGFRSGFDELVLVR